MKAVLFLVAIAVFLTAPAYAGHADCTAGMVTEGVCRDAANHVLFFDAPAVTFAELRDAIATQTGYRDQVECTQPLVDIAVCSIEQLGQMIVNPTSKADYAEIWLKGVLRQLVVRQRVADGRAASDGAVDPVVDVGD